MKLTFQIKRIMHMQEDTNFAIVKAKVKESDNRYLKNTDQTIKGIFKNVYENDLFEADVKEVTSGIYGKSYNINGTPKMIMPVTEKAVFEFILSRSKSLKGVGKKKIEKVVQGLGVSALEDIEEDHKVLLQFGFTEDKALKLQEVTASHKEFEDIIGFFMSMDVRADLANEILKEVKDITREKIIKNPYVLLASEKIDFTIADKIAFKLNKDPESVERKEAIVSYYLINRNKSNGDICVKTSEIIEDLADGDFLLKHGSYSKNTTIGRYDVLNVIDGLKQTKILSVDTSKKGEEHVYLTAFLFIENKIVESISQIKSSPDQIIFSEKETNSFISDYEETYFTLAERQKEAIYMASKNKFSILTGGPGTGKTQTTRAIVELFKSINPKATIKLLAPTGKASKRLAELTGMEAQTIHRALGIRGFGKEDDEITLEDDLIVVDESSMIDAQLFHKLLKNTSPNSRILLVGDSNQLDSVGAGRILSDLIESNSVAVTQLNEVFRQASTSQIVTNAHKMIEGKGFNELGGIEVDNSKGDFYFVERKHAKAIKEDILESIKRFMDKGYKLEDIMVLSAMKKGTIGTDELNRAIQQLFNPETDKFDHVKNNGEIIRVGDRVIHTENNKELGVFNGEIGNVQRIVEKLNKGKKVKVIEVSYPDKDEVVDYSGMNIEQLSLAYSITIHKSQGSESPLVIMPVHNTQQIMLDRSLVYTGITRAKQTVIVFGEKESFNNAIKRVKSSKRTSLVKEKLQSA